MTVFSVVRAKSDRSYAIVCDCLLTSDVKQSASIELPFQAIAPGADFTTYHLTRKAFLPHPRIMLLWSGNFLIAKVFARYLTSQIDRLLVDDPAFSFQQIIAERLSESEAMQCGFMLLRIFPLGEEGMRLRYHAFNCSKAEDDDFEYFGSGSGFAIASSHIWLGPDDRFEKMEYEDSTAPTQALRVLTNLLSNEYFTDTYKYSRAGGWYEVFIPARDGFVPVPYAINTFSRRDGSWDMLGRFSSFYSDGNLTAVRATFDLLAELSMNPLHQIHGTEFQLFPVVELHMNDPRPRRVQMTLQNIYGMGAQFSLNVFVIPEDEDALVSSNPGCDVLSFGESTSEISIDAVSIQKILGGLPERYRLPK